jgi:PPOX class probable F420-dependent enzyme
MYGLPEHVRDLFEGANYAHVATLLPDGAPHTVPVWVGLDAGRVVFLTGPESRKARNLERDPRIAISITGRDDPHTMAEVRGRVAGRLEGDPAFEVIDRLSHKYLGQPYPVRSGRVVYLVDVDHAWGMTFG